MGKTIHSVTNSRNKIIGSPVAISKGMEDYTLWYSLVSEYHRAFKNK